MPADALRAHFGNADGHVLVALIVVDISREHDDAKTGVSFAFFQALAGCLFL